MIEPSSSIDFSHFVQHLLYFLLCLVVFQFSFCFARSLNEPQSSINAAADSQPKVRINPEVLNLETFMRQTINGNILWTFFNYT